MPLPSSLATSRALRRWLRASLVGLGAVAQAALAQSSFDVGMRDGLVTIRANATPAAELAEALGQATGVAVVVTGEPATPLTIEIVDEPLHKAIAQLAPNHLLKRASADADADILEITLMMPDGANGGGDSTEFLPTGAPADDMVGVDDGSGVVLDANGQPVDAALLRDPGRSDAARVAGEAAIDPATGLPYDGSDGTGSSGDASDAGATFDEPPSGPAIDPATGLPVQ